MVSAEVFAIAGVAQVWGANQWPKDVVFICLHGLVYMIPYSQESDLQWTPP